MKALLTAMIIALSVPCTGLATNPLSAAEKPICQTLHHCLKIVDTHSHDSFDYTVLAVEFRRFDPKGRKALIRKIEKGGDSAAHAADLFALLGDASTLPRLGDRQAAATPTKAALIARTVAALQARITATASDVKGPPPALTPLTAQICPNGTALPFEARRREMPFFEQDVATPDAFGAYRPSAMFNTPLRFASRGWLRTARPVPGGWLAGYPDGLIAFDNRTGAPSLRIRGHVLSVQARNETVMTPETWAFLLNDKKQTYIVDVGPKMLRLVATLPGPLAELRRDPDGSIYAASAIDQAVTLLADGTYKPGCRSVEP